MQQQQSNKKEQINDKFDEELSNRKNEEGKFEKTKVKDAHAAGIGSIGKSDDNQIENLNTGEKKEDVY